MSLYLEQIRQLVALQHVDDHIHDVKKELTSAPQEVEELNARYQEQENLYNRTLDKLQHMKEQQKRLDVDLEDENNRLKKSKGKLMQVTNEREHQAMTREMDNMERSNQTREEERLALHEEITGQEAALKDVEKAWDDLKLDLASKQANLETRIEKAKAELEKLEMQRTETGSDVPAPVLSRYEFIRRRLDHPVIVPVQEGICSGCHIAIPPQTFIELQRGQQIWSCPNCQRLIYWAEHFHDDEGKKDDAENAPKKPMVFAEDLF